jgi:serine protease
MPEDAGLDGLGAYTVQVNRTGLADGNHTGSITFTSSSGGVVVVPVNLQVSTAAGTPDAGFHYVLLVGADTIQTVQQDSVQAVNGTYSYAFTGVTEGGSYRIFAGSDRDNDGFIDNDGESFGAYSSLDQITMVTVADDRNDLDFATDLKVSLPAPASASIRSDGAAGKLSGLKRLR